MEYKGKLEGDEPEAAVRAGEARKGSARGVERRLPAAVKRGGAGQDAGDGGVDYRLRRRLAEVLSSAGVDSSRVAVEVLYMLPQEFVRGYEDLFHRALVVPGDRGRGESDAREAELGKARGKAARKAGGRAGRGGFEVRNTRALGEKERIDRKLRGLARTMRDSANAGTGKEQVVRCGEGGTVEDVRGCGKWLEKGWKWCPYCGRSQG